MTQSYKQIILVTDALQSFRATIETAFSLAKRYEAKVTIVDTIREPSRLSRWLTPNAGGIFEMVLADKQDRLEKTAAQFREAGVETDTKVLIGNSSEAIAKEAIETGADLVIRYMKGVRSKYPGLFGNTARNLMRICPVPVLFVANQTVEHPQVMACINVQHEPTENDSILGEAEKLAGDSDKMFGVYCWDVYGKQIVKNHMSEESMEKMFEESARIHTSLFNQYLENNDVGSFEGKLRIENGEPGFIIPRICQQEAVDVVVMSSASTNHPLHRLLGSTVESVLDKLPCALLVVKPTGFESPIQANRSAAQVAQ